MWFDQSFYLLIIFFTSVHFKLYKKMDFGCGSVLLAQKLFSRSVYTL